MASQSTLDLTGFKLTFDDEFSAFSSNGPSNPGDPSHSGTWDTTLSYGERKLNDEVEMYSDPTVGINPFSVTNGCLDIHPLCRAVPEPHADLRRPIHLWHDYDQPFVLAALWLLRDACRAASGDRHVAGILDAPSTARLAAGA